MPDTRPGPLHVVLKGAARLKARGPREVTKLILTRLKEGISSDDALIFFVRPAGGEPEDRPGLSLRQLGPEDGKAYARDVGTDSPLTFPARLSPNTRCFAVEADGRLVHTTWATTAAAWTREISGYVRPPHGDAYVYESFTRAEMRGRGLYPFALEGIAARLGAEGVARLWVAVEADNPASVRAVTKASFRPAFEIAYRRRLSRLRLGEPVGELAAAADEMLARRK